MVLQLYLLPVYHGDEVSSGKIKARHKCAVDIKESVVSDCHSEHEALMCFL